MKALSFIVSISGINLSNKCVKAFEMERNFSDVSNKFSLTLIDSPDVLWNTPNTDITDLEILINEGHRSVSFSYTDSGNPSEYQTFSGTIWDYDSSFVGDIKQLTVTGYASRSASANANGDYFYNIDWNNYYNRRRDVTQPWNGLNQYAYKAQLTFDWELKNATNNHDDIAYFLDSATSDKNFLSLYNSNSLFVRLKGPGGEIALPIPDTFTTMVPHRYTEYNKKGEPVEDSDVGDVIDPDHKFWGEMEEISLKEYIVNYNTTVHSGGSYDGEKFVYNETKDFALNNVKPGQLGDVAEDDIILYVDKNGRKGIRGFSVDGGQTGFIQMNPERSYYGAGQLLTTSTGVDPSHIVRELAKLEGWDVGNIVQTEYVPCSDSFKMQHQTAKQFITDVLVPLSITPVGQYEVSEDFYTYEEVTKEDKTKDGKTTYKVEYVPKLHKKGETFVADKGQSGFVLYWRNGKVYYEPLAQSMYREHTSITKNIPLGYNVPNSNVISFKVATKGTAFFTSPVEVNALDIVTGEKKTTIVTTDKSSTEAYNKVKGHNEALDNFFGYTYEYIKHNYGDDTNATNGWVGISTLSREKNIYTDQAEADTFTSSLIQRGLVNRYANSAVNSDTEAIATAEAVKAKIRQYMVQATMNLWGDPDISPGCKIQITNMVKSSNKDVPEVHPTSGVYLVYKQKDTFDGSNYTQQLSMYRIDDTPINTYNVNFASQKAVGDMVKLAPSAEYKQHTSTTKVYEEDKKKFSAKTKEYDYYKDTNNLYVDARNKWEADKNKFNN